MKREGEAALAFTPEGKMKTLNSQEGGGLKTRPGREWWGPWGDNEKKTVTEGDVVISSNWERRD